MGSLLHTLKRQPDRLGDTDVKRFFGVVSFILGYFTARFPKKKAQQGDWSLELIGTVLNLNFTQQLLSHIKSLFEEKVVSLLSGSVF